MKKNADKRVRLSEKAYQRLEKIRDLQEFTSLKQTAEYIIKTAYKDTL